MINHLFIYFTLGVVASFIIADLIINRLIKQEHKKTAWKISRVILYLGIILVALSIF